MQHEWTKRLEGLQARHEKVAERYRAAHHRHRELQCRTAAAEAAADEVRKGLGAEDQYFDDWGDGDGASYEAADAADYADDLRDQEDKVATEEHGLCYELNRLEQEIERLFAVAHAVDGQHRLTPCMTPTRRTRARTRGAGRPRAQASRSSARSGDSGDDDGGSEPPPPRLAVAPPPRAVWTYACLTADQRGEDRAVEPVL